MKKFYINIDNNTRISIKFGWGMKTFTLTKEVRELVNAGAEKQWHKYNSMYNLTIEDLNGLRDALDKVEVMLLLK